MTVYTHEEFWSYELSKELYYRLSNSSKSTLAGCLLGAYRSEGPNSGDQFNYQIGNIANDRTKQRQFIAHMIQSGYFPRHPKEAIKQLMEDASLGFFFNQPSSIIPSD